MPELIKIVLPDAGPLITLAHANALDLLLVFNPDQVQLVVTDMVDFESTRQRSTHMDAQRIADFLSKHAGRIVIEKTPIGQMAIASANLYDRYNESQQVRDSYASNGMDPPTPPAPDIGELSIISYVMSLIGQPPGPACLVIAEDGFFLRSTTGVLPGNTHIISTATLLSEIEKINPKISAKSIFEAARKYTGRDPNRLKLDLSASKIIGGSEWTSSLNSKSLTAKLVKEINNDKKRSKQPR